MPDGLKGLRSEAPERPVVGSPVEFHLGPVGNTGFLETWRDIRIDDIAEYGQPGSNGLTLDREGRLTINEHGNRRVTRLEKNGSLTILADRYQGKRLNSPNDLV